MNEEVLKRGKSIYDYTLAESKPGVGHLADLLFDTAVPAACPIH
jgi:hypothetical protein